MLKMLSVDRLLPGKLETDSKNWRVKVANGLIRLILTRLKLSWNKRFCRNIRVAQTLS